MVQNFTKLSPNMHRAMCSNSFRVPSEVKITLDFRLSEELTVDPLFTGVEHLHFYFNLGYKFSALMNTKLCMPLTEHPSLYTRYEKLF